jgi:hypothetical protein
MFREWRVNRLAWKLKEGYAEQEELHKRLFLDTTSEIAEAYCRKVKENAALSSKIRKIRVKIK